MSFMDTFERGMEKILVPVAIKLNSRFSDSRCVYSFVSHRHGQFADYSYQLCYFVA